MSPTVQRRKNLHIRFPVLFPGQTALKFSIFFNNLTHHSYYGSNFAFPRQVLNYLILDNSRVAAVSDGVTLSGRYAAR